MPQGSIAGPILFNIFFNNFFSPIIMPCQSGCAINFFRDNSMIVNLDKFQTFLLEKRNSDLYVNKNITIDKENK